MSMCDRCRVGGCCLEPNGKACEAARKRVCPDVVYTNADRIRDMSDEELTRVIGHLYDGESGIHFCRNLAECDDDMERNLLIPLERCEACVLHWLHQPAEEDCTPC